MIPIGNSQWEKPNSPILVTDDSDVWINTLKIRLKGMILFLIILNGLATRTTSPFILLSLSGLDKRTKSSFIFFFSFLFFTEIFEEQTWHLRLSNNITKCMIEQYKRWWNEHSLFLETQNFRAGQRLKVRIYWLIQCGLNMKLTDNHRFRNCKQAAN